MSTNLSLSLELIKLLDFMLKNKDEQLQALVDEAVASGSLRRTVVPTDGVDMADYVNGTMTEFVEFLETAMIDSMNESMERGHGLPEQLVASLEKLDRSGMDPKLVWQSVQEAQSELSGRTVSDRFIRSALYQRILENWSPVDDCAQG